MLILPHDLLMSNAILPLHIRQRHMPAPISTADLLDLSEGDAGHEAGRLERLVDFGVELVDLFEGEAFGFVDPGGWREGLAKTLYT